MSLVRCHVPWLAVFALFACLHLQTSRFVAANNAQRSLRKFVGSRAQFGTSPSNFGSGATIISTNIQKALEAAQANDHSLSSNSIVPIRRLSSNSSQAWSSSVASATSASGTASGSYRRRLNENQDTTAIKVGEFTFNFPSSEFIDGGFYFGNKAATRSTYKNIAITPLQYKAETDETLNAEDDLTVQGSDNLEKLKNAFGLSGSTNEDLHNKYLEYYIQIDKYCRKYVTKHESNLKKLDDTFDDTHASWKHRYPISLIKVQAECRNNIAEEILQKNPSAADLRENTIEDLYQKLLDLDASDNVYGGYKNLYNALLKQTNYRSYRGYKESSSAEYPAPNFLSVVHQCAKLSSLYSDNAPVQFPDTSTPVAQNFRWQVDNNAAVLKNKNGLDHISKTGYAPCADETGKLPVWAMAFPRSSDGSSKNSFEDGKCYCGGDSTAECSGFQYCHAWRDGAGKTTKAMCDFKPRCDPSGSVDFTDDLIDAATGNVVCGMVLRGLHYDGEGKQMEGNTKEDWTGAKGDLRRKHYILLLMRLMLGEYYSATTENEADFGSSTTIGHGTYCQTTKFINDGNVDVKRGCPGDKNGYTSKTGFRKYFKRVYDPDADDSFNMQTSSDFEDVTLVKTEEGDSVLVKPASVATTTPDYPRKVCKFEMRYWTYDPDARVRREYQVTSTYWLGWKTNLVTYNDCYNFKIKYDAGAEGNDLYRLKEVEDAGGYTTTFPDITTIKRVVRPPHIKWRKWGEDYIMGGTNNIEQTVCWNGDVFYDGTACAPTPLTKNLPYNNPSQGSAASSDRYNGLVTDFKFMTDAVITAAETAWNSEAAWGSSLSKVIGWARALQNNIVEGKGFIDKCMCANSNSATDCSYDTTLNKPQYCLAGEQYANTLCSESTITMSGTSQNTYQLAPINYIYLVDGIYDGLGASQNIKYVTCGSTICNLKTHACSSSDTCVLLKKDAEIQLLGGEKKTFSYSLSFTCPASTKEDNQMFTGTVKTPNGDFTHNFGKCVCDNEMCDLNQYCYLNQPTKCADTVNCASVLGQTSSVDCVCSREDQSHICTNGQACAVFDTTLTTVDSTKINGDYSCFDDAVIKCGDETGAVRTSAACYCGGVSADKPVCAANTYCAYFAGEDKHTCLSHPFCTNRMVNLAVDATCSCSTTHTCNVGDYCVADGTCTRQYGPRVSAVVTSQRGTLSAERSAANEIIQEWSNINVGCRDIAACNYDKDAQHQPDDSWCTYPERYRDCNRVCLNRPELRWYGSTKLRDYDTDVSAYCISQYAPETLKGVRYELDLISDFSSASIDFESGFRQTGKNFQHLVSSYDFRRQRMSYNFYKVPLPDVAESQYGCPVNASVVDGVDFSKACNKLYRDGNAEHPIQKYWMYQFCILPPPRTTCKTADAKEWTNLYWKATSYKDVFSCDAGYGFCNGHDDCDQTMCGYHPDPLLSADTCFKPAIGKTCDGSGISDGDRDSVQIDELKCENDNKIMQILYSGVPFCVGNDAAGTEAECEGKWTNAQNSYRYNCFQPGEALEQSENTALLYDYYDKTHDDHLVDGIGLHDRRRLDNANSEESERDVTLQRYHLSSAILHKETLGTETVPKSYIDYVTQEDRFETTPKSQEFGNTALSEKYKEEAEKFWVARGDGVPSENYFKESTYYADDFFLDPILNVRVPMQFYDYKHSKYDGTKIAKSSGFWKRAFARESNTLAVEWFARQSVGDHIQAPPLADQADWYTNNIAGDIQELIRKHKDNPMWMCKDKHRDCDGENVFKDMQLPNKDKPAAYDPRVSAIHQNEVHWYRWQPAHGSRFDPITKEFKTHSVGDVIEDFVKGTADESHLAVHHDFYTRKVFGYTKRDEKKHKDIEYHLVDRANRNKFLHTMDVVDMFMWEHAHGYDYDNKVKITQVNHIKSAKKGSLSENGMLVSNDIKNNAYYTAKNMHNKGRWIYFDGDWIELTYAPRRQQLKDLRSQQKKDGDIYIYDGPGSTPGYDIPDEVDFGCENNDPEDKTKSPSYYECPSFNAWMRRRYVGTRRAENKDFDSYRALYWTLKNTEDENTVHLQNLKYWDRMRYPYPFGVGPENRTQGFSRRKNSGATKCNKRCMDSNYFASMFEIDLSAMWYNSADPLADGLVWETEIDPDDMVTYGECFCYNRAHAMMAHQYDKQTDHYSTGAYLSNRESGVLFERMKDNCEENNNCNQLIGLPHYIDQFLKIDTHFTDKEAKEEKRDGGEGGTYSLTEPLRVGYTFSCEAGTYYTGGDILGEGKFKCSFCPVGKFSLENYPVTVGQMEDSIWTVKTVGVECDICPLGSQAVTLTFHGNRVYRGSDPDHANSHASMCKHCPEGWSDARIFGQTYTDGCVNYPPPRAKLAKFTKETTTAVEYTNPCPESHPYLQKYGTTNGYFCYAEFDGQTKENHEVCGMHESEISPPPGGVWGTNQAACTDSTDSTDSTASTDSTVSDHPCKFYFNTGGDESIIPFERGYDENNKCDSSWRKHYHSIPFEPIHSLNMSDDLNKNSAASNFAPKCPYGYEPDMSFYYLDANFKIQEPDWEGECFGKEGAVQGSCNPRTWSRSSPNGACVITAEVEIEYPPITWGAGDCNYTVQKADETQVTVNMGTVSYHNCSGDGELDLNLSDDISGKVVRRDWGGVISEPAWTKTETKQLYPSSLDVLTGSVEDMTEDACHDMNVPEKKVNYVWDYNYVEQQKFQRVHSTETRSSIQRKWTANFACSNTDYDNEEDCIHVKSVYKDMYKLTDEQKKLGLLDAHMVPHCVPCGKGTNFHPGYAQTGYPWCATCLPGKYNSRHNHTKIIGRKTSNLGLKKLVHFTYRAPVTDAWYEAAQNIISQWPSGTDKSVAEPALICNAHPDQNPVVKEKSFTYYRVMPDGGDQTINTHFCELTTYAYISDYELFVKEKEEESFPPSFFFDRETSTYEDLCDPIPTNAAAPIEAAPIEAAPIEVVSEQALISYELVRSEDESSSYYEWQATGPTKLCPAGTDRSSNPYASTIDENGIVTHSASSLNPYYNSHFDNFYEYATDPGSTQIFAAKTCYACPAGRYRRHDMIQACEICPEGWFQSKQGQSHCNLCSSGRFTTRSESFLVDWDPDYTVWVNEDARNGVECQACEPEVNRFPEEAYRPFNGTNNCWTCPKGFYLFQFSTSSHILGVPNNANFCRECQPGQYSKELGQSSCNKCPAGQAEFLELIPRIAQSEADTRKYASINKLSHYFEDGPHLLKADMNENHAEWHYENQLVHNLHLYPQGLKEVLSRMWNFNDLSTEFLNKQAKWFDPPWKNKGKARQKITINADYVQAHSEKFYNPRSLNQCRYCSPGYYQNETGQTWGNIYYHEALTTTFANTDKRTGEKIEGYRMAWYDGIRKEHYHRYVSLQSAGLSWPKRETNKPFSYTTDVQGCKKCIVGKYQNEPGATNCKTCPEGYTSADSLEECNLCPEGRFSNFDKGVQECHACPEGWGSVPTRTECSACPKGSFAPKASACKLCALGQFQHETKQASCSLCSKGRYQNARGFTGYKKVTKKIRYTVDSRCLITIEYTGRYPVAHCRVGTTDKGLKTYDECDGEWLWGLGLWYFEDGLTPTPTPSSFDEHNNLICPRAYPFLKTCIENTGSEYGDAPSCTNNQVFCFKNNRDNRATIDRDYDDDIHNRNEFTVGEVTGTLEEVRRARQHCSMSNSGLPAPEGYSWGTRYTYKEQYTRKANGNYERQSSDFDVTMESDECSFPEYQERTLTVEVERNAEDKDACYAYVLGNIDEELSTQIRQPSYKRATYKTSDDPSKIFALRQYNFFDQQFNILISSMEPSVEDGGWFCEQGCPEGMTTQTESAESIDECNAQCPAGRFGDGYGCQKCQPGKYNSFAQQSECTYCPKGTYQSNSGGRICIPCNQGNYSSEKGLTDATKCTNCPVGYVKPPMFWQGSSDVSVYECQQVAAGLYMDETGKAKGKVCALGKYSDVPGLTQCKDCAAGKYLDARRMLLTNECVDCPEGRWTSDTGTEYARGSVGKVCKACEVGRYSQEKGATVDTVCKDCAAGRYNPIKGQKKCEMCDRGQYQGETGQSSCTKCESGKYSGTIGATDATKCKACQEGYTTDEAGAVACDKCPDGYGYDATENECNKCDPKLGQYNDAKSPPVDRGGICRYVVCPTGWGFNLDLAQDIPVASNLEGDYKAFCSPCDDGKFRDALASENTGQDDVCQSTSIPLNVSDDKKALLNFGEYYSFQPWRDVEKKVAVNCDDCGTSLCFRKQNEDGGDVTCKSYEGVPDFSDEKDYFGAGVSRCETLVNDISLSSVYRESDKNTDFCGDQSLGCTDSSACNYNPSADFDDGSCEYPPENGICQLDNGTMVKACFPKDAYTEVFDSGDTQCLTTIGAASIDAISIGGIDATTEKAWIEDMKDKASAYSNNEEEFPTTYDKLHGLRKYVRQNMYALKKLRQQLTENKISSTNDKLGWLLAKSMIQFRHAFYTIVNGSHAVVPADLIEEDKTNVVVFGPFNSIDGLEFQKENCEDLAKQSKDFASCITFDFENENSGFSYKYMLGCEKGCWNVFSFGFQQPSIRQYGIEKNKYSLSCWSQQEKKWINEMVKYSGDEYKCNSKLFIVGSLHTVSQGGCRDPEANRPANTVSCTEANPNDMDNEGCEYSRQYRNCNGTCWDEGEALPASADGTCTKDIGCNTACRQEEIKGCTDESSCQWQDYAENEKPNYGAPSECKTKSQYLIDKYPSRVAEFTEDRVEFLDCNGNCNNDALGNQNDGVCDEEEIEGCAISTACNYDDSATYTETTTCYFSYKNNRDANKDLRFRNCNETCDNDLWTANETTAIEKPDNICDELQSSCHNTAACNYQEQKKIQKPVSDDSLCEFAVDENGEMLDTSIFTCRLNGLENKIGGFCLNDDDTDGVCNELETQDCKDTTACNYMEKGIETADRNNDLCIYPLQKFGKNYVNCDGSCKNPSSYRDSETNQVLCDEDVIEGCMDPNACETNPIATHQPDGVCNYANSSGAYKYRDCNKVCYNDNQNPNNNFCDEEEHAECVDPQYQNPNLGIVSCNTIQKPQDRHYHEESKCTYSTKNRTCNGEYQLVLQQQGEFDLCKSGGEGYIVHFVWPNIDEPHLLFRSDTETCTDTKTLIAKTTLPESNSADFFSSYGVDTTNEANQQLLANLDPTTTMQIDTLAAADGKEHWITDCNENGIRFRVFCTGNVGCMDETACTYNSEANVHDNALCQYNDWCNVCGGPTVNGVKTETSCPASYYTGCDDTSACNYNNTKYKLQVHDESLCEYPTKRYCLNPCPEEGSCLGECKSNNINPTNDLCDEDEVPGCLDSNACNYASSATYNDSSMCVMPYVSEEYKYRKCDKSCTNNKINPNNNYCDEEEIYGCTDPDACNYDSSATVNVGCQPKDCKSFCAADENGQYTLTGPNTCTKGASSCDLSECCQNRDCRGDCDEDGTGPKMDCKGVCGGNASYFYTVEGETREDTECCSESERDCAHKCFGSKQLDALNKCKDPAAYNFCNVNADSDDICDDDNNDPCVKRSYNTTNLNNAGYDCAGTCNGHAVCNNQNIVDECDISDCCETGERDCFGTCRGTAQMIGEKCCPASNITKSNRCCDGVIDEKDNCCAPDDQGCDSICFSGLIEDQCGVCDGPGRPVGSCDCNEGTTVDALGECGGNCTADADNDDICDNNDPCVKRSTNTQNLDAQGYDCAGVCNGLNSCTDFLQTECDKEECCLGTDRGECDGVCGSQVVKDCKGECGGPAYEDVCGTCIGEGEDDTAAVDSNNNGICDDNEVTGCMDETACESSLTLEATIHNNTMCQYRNQSDLVNYECPVDGKDPQCIDTDEDGTCNYQEIEGCNIDEASDNVCTVGVEGAVNASNSVTEHKENLCRYPTNLRNCYGQCISGDEDGDGLCNAEDTCSTDNPCKNGATCKDNGDEKVTCTCAFGWTGDFCDEKDPCTKEYFDCGNGETSGFKIDGCTCACNTGWKKDSDEKCLNKIKACDPDDDGDDSDHPCGYGTCTDDPDEIGKYTCNCNNGYTKDEGTKHCTVCAAGKGWNEDIDNAKCVACEWPKTQSSTSPYDICRLQYCNGGRARKGSSEFLVTLNPATDNDNCEKCEDGKTSPPGTDPCRAVVCPSNMRAKSNDKIDQSLAHDNSQNCEAMSCSEIGFTCGTHGTITGKPADNTCACDCGDSGYTGNKCDDQINECDPNNDLDTSDHPCNRGTCVDKDGKANGYYECDCADTGYRGNNCNEQINECDETGNLKHQCHADAECTDGTSGYTSANKNKGYTCACKNGYSGDGFTCNNINECDTLTSPCPDNAACNDLIPSENSGETHDCDCNYGFEFNNQTNSCEDIKECDNNPCTGEGERCAEKEGKTSDFPNGYVCECIDGYTDNESGGCTDVDECEANTHNCVENLATCSNNIDGGYKCICNAGYDGDGKKDGSGCADINHCASENACAEGEICFNIVGFSSAYCQKTTCQSTDLDCVHGSVTGNVGFPAETSSGWTDINQIVRDTTGCDCNCDDDGFVKRLVANSEFAKNSCTVCPAGSGRNSTTEKCEVCADEYVNSQTTYRAECAPLTCDPGYGYTTDWDASLDSTNSGNCVECEGATTSPSGNGQCAAIQCDRGYKPIAEGDIDHTVSNTDPKNCEDIKECDSNPCHSKATCHEVEGSTDQYSEGYYCTCNEPWYEGDGKEQCEHKNLCETDTCDTDYERCVNGEESNPTCKDKNECETLDSPCPANAACTNHNYTATGNSYSCACNDGYEGNGEERDALRCTLKDLCEGVDCSGHGDCQPTDGTCICNTGWYGQNCWVNPVDCDGDAATNSLVAGYDNRYQGSTCGGVGICVDGDDTFTCLCDGNYTTASDGKSCEVKDICTQNTCNNRGDCRTVAAGVTKCFNCDQGYEGENCEIDVDYCDGVDCNGNGVCEDGLTGYTCNCFPGWTSNDNLEGQEDCAVNIDDCPSTNVDIWISQGDSSAQPWYRFYTNANCNSNSEVSDPTKLQAYTTYTFKRCSSATSHPFAIQIGGSWTADLISNSALTLNVENPGTQFSWKCTQHGGMNGIFTAQDVGVCRHGSQCKDKNTSYTCDCAGTGYTGTYCQTDKNECENHQCQNGAECTHLVGDPSGSYDCKCVDDYDGEYCEIPRDYCAETGNSACKQGNCTNVQGGYECICNKRFSGRLCDTCQAGYGWNGLDGWQSECEECADGYANAVATHSTKCVQQRCRPGYGVVDDSQFSKTQNPNDDDNNVNCHECTGGFVSPDYTGVCVEIVCGSHKVVKNGYDNTLQFDDQKNCVCRNDANNNGKCDETENFKCGADDAPEACNGEELNEPAGDAHKESLCYYADSNNVGYNNPSEPIAPMKHANCDGSCFAGYARDADFRCKFATVSRAASVSEIRNNFPNDKTKRQEAFVEAFKQIVEEVEDDQEAPKTPKQKRYESRIPIVVQDLPTSIANIVQEKLTAAPDRELKMVVSPCTNAADSCSTSPTATDDSCVTVNLEDDAKTKDLTRYVLENTGCWQVLGTNSGPIAKQTKTENAYRWQCWQDDNRWSTPTQMFAGTNYVCRGRTLLTGSATDLTNYGCTAPTVNGTKNCNYDPQAEVDDGSCVDAEDLIKPGYDCYGAAIESQRVCQIGSCTDDELVKAYQKVNQGCGVTEGAHTYRPDLCVTAGCNATELDEAYNDLHTGQCAIDEY